MYMYIQNLSRYSPIVDIVCQSWSASQAMANTFSKTCQKKYYSIFHTYRCSYIQVFLYMCQFIWWVVHCKGHRTLTSKTSSNSVW